MTTFDAFLDDFDAALARGAVPLRAFNDEHIHETELDRIFTRAWVYLGHESEIPGRGDYVQRRIGRDPFVLVRSDDGEIRALFDTCRHRGAMVCRAERGNAAVFRCPYHGWTYKNSGAFAGAPFYKAAYGTTLNKAEMGLYAAPHVESLHGFVFASLDPDAPPLGEYLGPMKWYFDLIWGQCPDGWEVIGDPQRFVIAANWKSAADNFCGDDYHTFYLHRSTIETGIMDGVQRGDLSENLQGYHVQAGNGHAISHFLLPPGVPGPHFWGYPPEVQALFSHDAVDAERYDVARRSIGCVGTIFPNFCFLSFPLRYSGKADAISTMVIRTFEPTGPSELSVWSWVLCPRGAPDDYRGETYRTTQATFSAGGTFEQDDSEPWVALGRSARTTYGRKIGFELNYQMGMTGAAEAQIADDHPGPGIAFYPVLEEGVHRGFHRRWSQFMRAEAYPPAMTPEEQNAGAGTENARG